MVALRRYLRPPPGPRIRPLLAEDTDIPELPDPGPGPGRLTVLTQTVLQALGSLDEETRTVTAFYRPRVASRAPGRSSAHRSVISRARMQFAGHLREANCRFYLITHLA